MLLQVRVKWFVWNKVQAAKTLLAHNILFSTPDLANIHPVHTPVSKNMMIGGRGFIPSCPPPFVLLWAATEMELNSLLGPFDADQDEFLLF